MKPITIKPNYVMFKYLPNLAAILNDILNLQK